MSPAVTTTVVRGVTSGENVPPSRSTIERDVPLRQQAQLSDERNLLSGERALYREGTDEAQSDSASQDSTDVHGCQVQGPGVKSA